jgi:lipoprotein-anchoring transpeptidase ErfK/SrfK
MARMFVSPRVIFSVAAGAAVALVASQSGAWSQVVDPGWQVVYAGQPGYDDGLTSSMAEDGQVIVGRAFEPPAPIYSAGDPVTPPETDQRASTAVAQPAQPVAAPRVPSRRPLPLVSAQPAGQGAVYRQPASQAQLPAPAGPRIAAPIRQGQLRGSQPAVMNYRVATAPPPSSDPSYTGAVPAQQVRAEAAPANYQAAAALQPPSQPVAHYAAPVPQGRGLFSSFQAAPAAYPPAARQQLAFGYQTQPQQGYAYPAPAYAPSTYGDMAQQQQMDPRYERQVVDYGGSEKPGTVIVDTPHFFLYLVMSGGKALRYGIGVGRPGFTWAGVKSVSAKREWPDWRPPDEMIARRPDLPHFMPGGPENPLGARALYLGSSLYRIHGSNEPWSIGTQVSSGCIRLRNDDIIDLYGRVKVGAKVIVI